MGSTWSQPRVRLDYTWGQPVVNMNFRGLTWDQPGGNLESTWGQPEDDLGSTWGQHGFYWVKLQRPTLAGLFAQLGVDLVLGAHARRAPEDRIMITSDARATS